MAETSKCMRAALFDLDGTLVDSLPDLHYGIEVMLSRRGLPGMSEEEVGRYVGKGVVYLVEMVLKARNPSATEEELGRFIREYVQVMAEIGNARTRRLPTVAQSLEGLRQRGVILALVTNKSGSLIADVLAKTGLDSFFPQHLRLSPEAVKTPKPAPDMLLLAAERAGVPPGECVMFGDSRNDALAGRAAGMRSVLLKTGYNEGEPIEVWGPKNGFNDIFETLGDAIETLNL